MPFHQPDSIRYYVFDSLAEAGVIHAVFTRRGGVSPTPWESLNVGGLRGDDPGRVLENRIRSFQTVGRDPRSVYDVWQVHSTEIVVTSAPRPPHNPHIQADAIFTDHPGVSLFMRFGDCVPILLYDPAHRVVGLVHAGWQGTVKGFVKQAIKVMQEKFASQPAEILAAIGPSIAAHHYEIGPDVALQVRQAFGIEAESLLTFSSSAERTGVAGHRDMIVSQHISIHNSTSSERPYFDLWAANQLLLEQAGVWHIETAGLCTACHLEDWYSHRGEQGNTGRFGVLIALSS